MAWKRKVTGGVLAMIGFMLSPLSWWNDLFVNVPLALAFAWLVSLFYKPAFAASLVIGYWLTNVLGFHPDAQRRAEDRVGEARALFAARPAAGTWASPCSTPRSSWRW